jgi:hypothetical protein
MRTHITKQAVRYQVIGFAVLIAISVCQTLGFLNLGIGIALQVAFAFFTVRQTYAFLQLKHLEGFLPVCGYCKRMRTPDQSWVPFETYISDRSDALFSHGICPECMRKEFQDFHQSKH